MRPCLSHWCIFWCSSNWSGKAATWGFIRAVKPIIYSLMASFSKLCKLLDHFSLNLNIIRGVMINPSNWCNPLFFLCVYPYNYPFQAIKLPGAVLSLADSAPLPSRSLRQQAAASLEAPGQKVAVFSQSDDSNNINGSSSATKTLIGFAIRCGQDSSHPVWVSTGHRISFESATQVVQNLACQVSVKFWCSFHLS